MAISVGMVSPPVVLNALPAMSHIRATARPAVDVDQEEEEKEQEEVVVVVVVRKTKGGQSTLAGPDGCSSRAREERSHYRASQTYCMKNGADGCRSYS